MHRRILALSWPAIATNITTPLLSLIDVAIVGHIAGEHLIGAVAVGGTVFNILYWLFGFLRMGTSGLTAQAFGSRNHRETRYMLLRGITLAMGAALVVLTAAYLFGHSAISLVDGADSVTDTAYTYFSVAILGAPGVLLSFVVSGWLLGMQRSRPILWIALVTNILNIILSVVFVFVLDLGIVGVGLGTALSQIVGATTGLLVARRIFRTIPRENRGNDAQTIPSNFLDGKIWGTMFRVNRDIFLRTLCLAAVTLWFTHAGSALGPEYLTANALLMQLFMLFSYFTDGFAFGGEALAGRYYGAGRYDQLRSAVVALFEWGVGCSLVFTALYFFCGDIIVGILTDDASARTMAAEYRLWAVVVPFAGFSAFTWDGIFVGLARTGMLLSSMAAAMMVFFIVYFGGTALISDVAKQNHILWLAFILYLAVRGLLSTILYRRFSRSLKQ